MQEQKNEENREAAFGAEGGGLSQTEADRRCEEEGRNALASPPAKSYLQMFAEQLNDPLILILFAAAGVSVLLKEYADAFIILSIIALNAAVGVIQEGKAQKALLALKDMACPMAVVRRDGIIQKLPAENLVKGDHVLLEAGSRVPADLRLLKTISLRADESALTGEAEPVEKDARFHSEEELPLGDRRDMAFMSTNIVYGRGEGVVTATGMDTQIGRIAGLISEEKQEKTPLQKRLADLGKILSAAAIAVCILLFLIAVIRKADIFSMLLTAISLAVAAVPEGLPAIVTIVLALGVLKMAKVNTIVKHLPAVETLGAVDVVCSDKTGTLTRNEMRVVSCFADGEEQSVAQLAKSGKEIFIRGFLLCCDAAGTGAGMIGDPTECALIRMGEECGVLKDELTAEWERIDELPFDAGRRRMSTKNRSRSGECVSYTKGAADVILELCSNILEKGRIRPMTEEDKRQIDRACTGMAQKALRVLALAMDRNGAMNEKNLTFVGLAGMMDPPREEAAKAVRIFARAGVRTVMITGDHVDTAYAVAQKTGIAKWRRECMTGEELDRLEDRELRQRVGNIRVFARVSPEHKVRIVKAYKALGKTVAMTGDGVNDAPSLQAADVGVAMGKSGTDVAKNAADLILTDDNFATIEKAIGEGRGIYENIRKSVLFLLSSNFGEIIAMFTAVAAGFAVPLKASHILWVNLLTDSLPALALGVDTNDRKELMLRRPQKRDKGLLADGGWLLTLFYGGLIAFVTLAAFLTLPYGYICANGMKVSIHNLKLVLEMNDILVRSQTYAFTVLGISELFHAVGMRNTERSVFSNGLFTNLTMTAAFAAGILLQLAVTQIGLLEQMFGTVKLSAGEWARLLFLSSMPLLAHEIMVVLQMLPLPAFLRTERRTELSGNP